MMHHDIYLESCYDRKFFAENEKALGSPQTHVFYLSKLVTSAIDTRHIKGKSRIPTAYVSQESMPDNLQTKSNKDEEGSLFKGLIIGAGLSIPLWLSISTAVHMILR